MKKAVVVFWSSTGNTEMMADALVEGIVEAGQEADKMEASLFDASALDQYDVIAFGCPAMGDEVLEESEFEPMFAGVEGSLGGKKVALFGSYGWGDGQWMRDWCDRVEADGALLVNAGGLMVNGTPGDLELEECKALGKEIAAA